MRVLDKLQARRRLRLREGGSTQDTQRRAGHVAQRPAGKGDSQVTAASLKERLFPGGRAG